MSATGPPPSSEGGAVAFCTSCGKPVPVDAKFCRQCGTKQEEIAPQQIPMAAPVSTRPSEPPSISQSFAPPARTRPFGVTIVALLLILFGIGGFSSFAIDRITASTYGWTPRLYFNLALILFYTPADFVMAIGLLKGRLWGWKLAVASLFVLFWLNVGSMWEALIFDYVVAVIFFPFWIVTGLIWIYLGRSSKVRSYFGAEDVWLRFSNRVFGYRPSGDKGQ